MDVNRGFIHKVLASTIFLSLFLVSAYTTYTTTNAGLQVICFFVALIFGAVIGFLLCSYAVYAFTSSDRYTYQEWLKK